MSEIQKTTNYKQFKLLEYNRDIIPSHVQNLCARIKNSNDLHLFPIIVTSNFEVVDGQHRLEAAKELKLPIYYLIDDNFHTNKITDINTSNRNWALEDFVKKFTILGNENYRKLRELAVDLKLPLHTILKWISPETRKIDFKKGNFKFKISQEVLNGLLCLKKLIGLFQKKNFRPKSIYGKPAFHEAMRKLLLNPLVDFEQLHNKLEANFHLVHMCFNGYDYLQMFLEIYNFRTREENALKLQRSKKEYEITK